MENLKNFSEDLMNASRMLNVVYNVVYIMESGISGIVLLLNFRSNKKNLPGTLQDFCVSELV